MDLVTGSILPLKEDGSGFRFWLNWRMRSNSRQRIPMPHSRATAYSSIKKKRILRDNHFEETIEETEHDEGEDNDDLSADD